MVIELKTIVSSGPVGNGKKVGNLTLQDAKFFGRPNFSGIEDQFKDARRKFTVLIPNELADQLREMGWNVKTLIPTDEERSEGREDVSCLRVMVDDSSTVAINMNNVVTTQTVPNFGIMDRTRITEMDMEIRAWEYDPEEKPGNYSARLVAVVATIEPNILEQKYGIL